MVLSAPPVISLVPVRSKAEQKMPCIVSYIRAGPLLGGISGLDQTHGFGIQRTRLGDILEVLER